MIRKVITAILAASAIYLLPAVVQPAALRHPQLWILVLVGVLISIFQPVYKPVDRTTPAHDRGTAAQIVWSVYLTQFIGVIEAVAFRYPRSFVWDVVTSVALVGIVAGLSLRVWAVRTLGRYFTWFITVYDDHKVIRSGPFRFIRHPAYGGALILFVSTLVFLHAWISVALSFAFQLFAYVRRIHYEEEMMVDRLGESYVAYKREVRALVPLLW
ncbi:MAG TPA: isoprenylcysteine carboxylmethyltransferase family protein [Thermoanaerobaculia bacterium]|nr:isoprenylcysteine carboxylmethyltransferase family protein [Thermoanaerobaculia bacterium]